MKQFITIFGKPKNIWNLLHSFVNVVFLILISLSIIGTIACMILTGDASLESIYLMIGTFLDIFLYIIRGYLLSFLSFKEFENG